MLPSAAAAAVAVDVPRVRGRADQADPALHRENIAGAGLSLSGEDLVELDKIGR
jgi:hypothetical protein